MSIDSRTGLKELLEEVRGGNAAAAERLWLRFWPRLLSVADRKLGRDARREQDEEDFALSAFRTFVRRAGLGQFDGLESEGSLWKLLCVILSRKIIHNHRQRQTTKRGGGKQREEGDAEDHDDEQQVFMETLEHLLSLGGPELQPFILMRLEGYENEEIAERLGVSTRTVERRLAAARRAWQQSIEETD